ncbi:hypothetical protein BJ508DRAFT_192508, partial [Ascobolus immersus RN42]
QTDEEEDIISEQTRRSPVLTCLIHIVPIAAAVTLVGLNASNYYVGGELEGLDGHDGKKLAALAFAARLQELFLLLSLATLAFSAYKFTKRTGMESLWISILVICSVLGVFGGPAIGALMIPELGDWPAGGTPFWINATNDMLFPESLEDSPGLQQCIANDRNLACPTGAWESLAGGYLSLWPQLTGMGSVPQQVATPGKQSVQIMNLRSRNANSLRDKMIWANAFTIATVPTSAAADALTEFGHLWTSASANGRIGRSKFRQDAIFTTVTEQPIVFVRCSQIIPSSAFLFPALNSLELDRSSTSATQLMALARVGAHVPYSNVTTEALDSLLKSTRPSLLWISSPELLAATNSTLAVVASIPTSQHSRDLYTCSVDSRFAKTTLRATRNNPNYVSGDTLSKFDQLGPLTAEGRSIRLTTGWAKHLNPPLPDRSSTVFASLASTAGLWNSTVKSNPAYHEIIVENILATLIANGIGRACYNTALLVDGYLKNPITDKGNGLWDGGEWVKEILPKKGRMGSGGSAFIVPELEQQMATKLQMKAFVTGYAYTWSGNARKAAIGVLSVYSALALLHIIYRIREG